LTLVVPDLARTEVLALRPDTGPLLDRLAAHPRVLLGALTDELRAAIEDHLASTAAMDVLAGWVARLRRQRGRAPLTRDPGRLHRLPPDLDTVDFLMAVLQLLRQGRAHARSRDQR